MQIQEVKTKLRELEDQILDLIIKFQNETACSVVDVTLESTSAISVEGYYQNHITGLSVELRL